MSRLEQLTAAIDSLPAELSPVQQRLQHLLDAGELRDLRAYAVGLNDMAYALTSEETTLAPLRKIVGTLS